MCLFFDFPIAPEGHPSARIVRSYVQGGYVKPAGNLTPALKH